MVFTQHSALFLEVGMRFGVHGLNFGRVAGDIPTLLQVATRADDLGFDSVWVGDHVIIPRQIASAYPYSPTGMPPFKPEEAALEPLTLLSYLAGRTTRVRLGISVLIVPHRNPLYTAKVVATLDVLSGGRVICGIGAGWLREEFEALGLSFDRRGEETDEWVRIFKVCWQEGDPEYHGRLYAFDKVAFEPKPVQKPHPPIWVGGNSRRAMRRAVELGDAWHPGWSRPDQLAGQLRQLTAIAEKAGRDPASLELTLLRPLQILDGPAKEPRRPLIGSADQVAEDIRHYARIGVSHLVFGFRTTDGPEMLQQVERFAAEVRPLLA
jgi:probable F420-dependent oxidoreductase